MRTAVAFIFCSFFGFCHVAPASPFEDAFKLGTLLTYNFENDVSVGNTKNAENTVGYRIEATVKVGTVWCDGDNKLLKFELDSPKLSTKKYKTADVYDYQYSTLETSYNKPVYAHWNLGHIKNVFFSKKETLVELNLIKGIISLFQYQLLDGTYVEKDVSGTCDATYVSHSTTRYHKSKTNCQSSGENVHELKDKVLGASLKLTRNAEIFVTPGGNVERIENEEYFKYLANVYDNIGGFLDSSMTIKADGPEETIDIVKGQNVHEVVKNLNLKSQSLESSSTEKEKSMNLLKIVQKYKKVLKNKNFGKQESALALLDMVQAGRKTDKEGLELVLKAPSTQSMKTQLCDLYGAIQTKESYSALKKVVDFKDPEQFQYVERYLQALAVGTRPTEAVISNLVKITESTKLKSKKLYDTLIQTVASMAFRFTKLPGIDYQHPVVSRVTTFLVDTLNECEGESCQLIVIRGIQNLKSPTTLDTLLKLAVERSSAVSVAAMKALRSYSLENNLDNHKHAFENIFYEKSKRFDSSARALALDIILDLELTIDDIQNLLSVLKNNDRMFEIKQYLIQNLKMSAESCPEFRKKLRTILNEDHTLHYYHVFGMEGLSTALSRKMSSYPSFNGSIVSLQEMSHGVLKRGIVDLKLEAEDNKFSLFTLGMTTGGLSSYVGYEDAIHDEDTTETAGMEITVQGSSMRPLVFFTGKTEFMSHIWSGTASEPTPAYQATTMLQDNEQIVKLQNGVTVHLSMLGAMSIDLTGKVGVSLWNRNGNSEVQLNIGTALIGKIQLDTPFISVGTNISVTQEPKVHLLTDLDFGSTVAVCMKLTQPDTVLSQKVTNYQKIPNTKDKKEFVQNVVYKLPGYTHFLNEKNSEICRTFVD